MELRWFCFDGPELLHWCGVQYTAQVATKSWRIWGKLGEIREFLTNLSLLLMRL